MWNIHIAVPLASLGMKDVPLTYVCTPSKMATIESSWGCLSTTWSIIIGQLLHMINKVKNFLHSRFKMKDMGAAIDLLGMEIWNLPQGDVLLLQDNSTLEVLQKFVLSTCNSTSPPVPPYSKLSQVVSSHSNVACALMATIPYRIPTTSLMYLEICTRPDISAAVSSLIKFSADLC